MYEEVEDTIPEEFEEIGAGTIRWGIDEHNLEDLETRGFIASKIIETKPIFPFLLR